MKYASTAVDAGIETVIVVMPLASVPDFDPENPHPQTYGVPDDVEPGWRRNSDGSFAPQPPTIAESLARIDAKAEAVRLRYITGGGGQAATYITKQAQAKAFRDAGYAGDVPLFVQAEADSMGASPQTAADTILAAAAAWEVKGAEIERVRRTGKIAVEMASDAARASVESAALTALDVL